MLKTMSKNSKDDFFISDASQLSTSSTTSSDKNKQSEVNKQGSQKNKKSDTNTKYCNICDVHVCGNKNYEDHLSGQKHRKCIEAKEKKNNEKSKEKNTKKTSIDSVYENNADTSNQPIKSLSLKRGPNSSRSRDSNLYDKNSENYSSNISPRNNYKGNVWNNNYSPYYNNNNYPNQYNDQYNNYQRYKRNYSQGENYYGRDYNQQNVNNSQNVWNGAANYTAGYYQPEYGYYGSENNEYPNNFRMYDNANKLNNDVPQKEDDNMDSNQGENKAESESDSVKNKKVSSDIKLIEGSETTIPASAFNDQMGFNGKLVSNFRSRPCDEKVDKAQSPHAEIESVKQLVTSENVNERISHWLNPLNSRDKAEVNKLVTEFSKSKKKENLLRLKQHSDVDKSNEDNAEGESLFQKLEQLHDSLTGSRLEDEEAAASSLLARLDSNSSKASPPKPRKRKKSSLSESSLTTNDNIEPRLSKSPLSRSSSVTEERKRGRKSRWDSCSSAKSVSEVQLRVEVDDVLGKRQSYFSEAGRSKKHKCSASQCLEKCIHEDGDGVHEGEVQASSYDDVAARNEIYCTDDISLKQEQMELSNSRIANPADELFDININNTEILDVEDLMKMFAAKNVTIKKEFDDPLIDAIKNIDVDLLLNVCDQQQTPSSKEPPASKETSNQSPQPSTSQQASKTAPKRQADKTCVPGPEVMDNPKSKNSSEMKTFAGLSPFNVYVNISNELKKLQKEEEVKRNNLKGVDIMIERFQKILNELRAKKIKLQLEEDNLISRRNALTCALSQCVTNDSTTLSLPNARTQDTTSSSSNSSEISNALINAVSQLPNIAGMFNTSNHSTPDLEGSTPSIHTSPLIPKKEKALQGTEEDEEIVIIPKQDMPVEIPVIDLELDSPDKKGKENVINNSTQSFYEKKSITAHDTVVNSLKVFGEFLYTCSNDYTAKRFSLKDSSLSVTYKHTKRNVLQLCVEIFNTSTLVFTLCSNDKVISAYNAEDGTLLKTYNFDAFSASIASSWGKVFVGLKNGSVMVCTPKESKELVKNYEPIKSIACTFQGGLHVLVILATNGQVAVRDVERNGLLIRYIKTHSDTPLFMNVYNDCVYLSSSVLLTVSDLSSGILLQNIKLASPITGLTAHENNIFTTSFSGIVRCYPDGQVEDMKMVYGAGKNALTSIYVYQGWVFTGNRNGVVSVFKFDPSTEYHCKFNKCHYVFTQSEDLDLHLLKWVHHKMPMKNVKCPWRGCQTSFTKDWKLKDRKHHFREHITKESN